MLPDPLVCVEESEVPDYAPFFPAAQIVPHPRISTFGGICNWILDRYKDRPVALFDDDLRGAISLVSDRKIDDPAFIRQIIENGVQILTDLNLGIFCWSRQLNPIGFRGHNPFNFDTYGGSAWVINTKRPYRFDERFAGRTSVDLSLSALLWDRIIMMDCRYAFWFDPVFSGRGGLQGMRTASTNEADEKLLKSKWGPYVRFNKTSWRTKKNVSAASVSILVKRGSHLAST